MTKAENISRASKKNWRENREKMLVAHRKSQDTIMRRKLESFERSLNKWLEKNGRGRA